jgi:hypothetical protein
MPLTQTNDISIYHESHGRQDSPLILIQGLPRMSTKTKTEEVARCYADARG